jgi:hypothetical protein
MLKPSEDLPLLHEPPRELLAAQTLSHEFDRDLLLELTVRALGQPDDAHPTFAQFSNEAIRTDDVSSQGIAGWAAGIALDRSDERRRTLDCGRREEGGRGVVSGDQFPNLALERRVATAVLRDGGRSLVLIQFEDRVEDQVDSPPALTVR